MAYPGRFLEENVLFDPVSMAPSIYPSRAPSETLTPTASPTLPSDLLISNVLRTTLQLYGGLFFLMWLAYCLLRRRYPRVFNVRNSVEELKSPLSLHDYGSFSWMWKVFAPSDEDIFKHCGMDAIAFLRILRFGMKVALVGSLNSIYLIPTYATARWNCEDGTVSNCQLVRDKLEKVGLGHVPSESNALLAPAFAAYVLFGSAMYFLLQEFKWFTEFRHEFLARPRPDNYTVYVRDIPPEYRSDEALLTYFTEVFHPSCVLEANVALYIPSLEKAVAERDALVEKLEHAVNVRDVTGRAPTHMTAAALLNVVPRGVVGGGDDGEAPQIQVDSITTYLKELDELNEQISDAITKLELQKKPPREQPDSPVIVAKNSTARESSTSRATSNDEEDGQFGGAVAPSSGEEQTHVFSDYGMDSSSVPENVETKEKDDAADDTGAFGVLNFTGTAGGELFKNMTGTLGKAAGDGTAFATRATSVLASAVLGAEEDGDPRNAAFVTFTNLRSKAQALQIIHHATPFTLKVHEAPLPKDIYWSNVGQSHHKTQMGQVLGLGMTVMLCFFWTIPVATISAFAEVDNLKKVMPILDTWAENQPWMEQALAQVKPLLIIAVRACLPIILLQFAKLEGHIAETTLQASLFSKLSSFYVVQIFFVQALSGAVMSEVSRMIDEPSEIVTLLATSLPRQAASFMQYVLVETFLGMGLELLRVFPVVIATIRGRVGPNLTEKERNSVWMGLNPLSVPPEFDFTDTLSKLILYFVILMVYATSAPVTSYIMGFCFCLLSVVYRNQFIFIYPTWNDTGGQLWTHFVQFAISSMWIAQLTMFGVLGLKGGYIAGPLMMPLFLGTIAFNIYIRQEHYHVTQHLPSRDCALRDAEFEREGRLLDFVEGHYLQPALQEKTKLPENLVRDEFITPTNSVRGDADYLMEKNL